ncbi:MAG: metalloregulator ArsR/SmtB family transcription factor [Cyclobacteriaceae bacterium]|jgi:DNA-binding transcriptional ArsR family regulator|nr:transcriptional regulator [Cytophagales bacterium]HNP78173.1 metalloregulator ArsR/SmtB family transcription factor [Cyclobacteriaceae bacterium]HQQ82938.1 metalloregulator ArsR/SmtB family transcription factor [Cyclobacteriaceae bacterium]
MGITKTEEYTLSQNELASLAKALGHPARVAILQFLSQQTTCVCGDIVEELPLSQSTVSQHLKELKKVGLIKGEIEGPSICYCIDTVQWKRASQLLTTFFNDHTQKCC